MSDNPNPGDLMTVSYGVGGAYVWSSDTSITPAIGELKPGAIVMVIIPEAPDKWGYTVLNSFGCTIMSSHRLVPIDSYETR